jgi:hypothetical protein
VFSGTNTSARPNSGAASEVPAAPSSAGQTYSDSAAAGLARETPVSSESSMLADPVLSAALEQLKAIGIQSSPNISKVLGLLEKEMGRTVPLQQSMQTPPEAPPACPPGPPQVQAAQESQAGPSPKEQLSQLSELIRAARGNV